MAVNSARRAALRLLVGLAAGGAAGSLALGAGAQDGEGRARPNVDYRAIAPQPVPGGNAIEVIEFFWYGCPYCYQLQRHFDAWVRRQEADVVVRRVPAVFRASWLPHARLYHTLEALGAVERLHQQVYDAYHVEQTPLNSSDAIAEWAERHGIDRERWLAVYRSEDIDRQVAQAREHLVRYAVSGTPTLVVDGRYLTSSAMTPGVAAMIPVLDYLVGRVRSQHGAR